MNAKFYISVLHATGATPRACLANAHLTESQIDRVLGDPAVDTSLAINVRILSSEKVQVVVSPMQRPLGWGVWYAYVKRTFETVEEAKDFGARMMRSFVAKGRSNAKKFEVWQMVEQAAERPIANEGHSESLLSFT
jgi:hypothetical protein